MVTIIVFLAGLGLWMGVDVYRGYAFRSEERLFVSALQRARLAAMVNVNASEHGVHIEPDAYTEFQGASYGAEPAWDRAAHMSYRVSFSGNPVLPQDIVFSQLSGAVAGPNTVTLSDGIRNATITIDHEGRISW